MACLQPPRGRLAKLRKSWITKSSLSYVLQNKDFLFILPSSGGQMGKQHCVMR